MQHLTTSQGDPHLMAAASIKLAGGLLTWLRQQAHTLLEPVLHPSPWRIRAIALCTFLGHPLYFLVWTAWQPQPYESLPLRVLMSLLGLVVLITPGLARHPPSWSAAALYSFVLWVTLPVFFSWMYLCNGGNPVWLASMGAMFLIYYHVTDWRLATLGCVAGICIAVLLYSTADIGVGTSAQVMLGVSNLMVIAFCWSMGLILGLSTSNLQREQLQHTLSTLGIMAHELRTPLATVHLVAENLRHVDVAMPDAPQRLARLSTRLEAVVHSMNHQIDTEISNARFTEPAASADDIDAAELVQLAVAGYPFRTPEERALVTVRVTNNFHFMASRPLFSQVVTNLTKNALRALADRGTDRSPCLVIEVTTAGDRGVIHFADNGIGMSAELQARLFQPFVSTQRGSGHGLGLAFCQRAVQHARGRIRATSKPGDGSTFTIELPRI